MLVSLVLATAMWELGRSRYTARLARLRLLRDQAGAEMEPRHLSRVEMDELQQLLGIDPCTLSLAQAERLLELRTRFGAGRVPRRPPTRSTVSTASATSMWGTREPRAPATSEAGVQTVPTYELMENIPVPRVEIREVIPEGPYYHVPGRNRCSFVS